MENVFDKSQKTAVSLSAGKTHGTGCVTQTMIPLYMIYIQIMLSMGYMRKIKKRLTPSPL